MDNVQRSEPKIVKEIILAEKSRARQLMTNTAFQVKVEAIRRKYIVNNYLVQLYSTDGRYSHYKSRVSRFGETVLTPQKIAKVRKENDTDWIKPERYHFMRYLAVSQETLVPGSTPEYSKVGGIPAISIWEEFQVILKEFSLLGIPGGGVLVAPYDIDYDFLSHPVGEPRGLDGQINYLGSYLTPELPGWLMKYNDYNCLNISPKEIEIRPSWFGLANHVFYNTPLRLPVFAALFSLKVQLVKFEILDDTLSDQTRNWIGRGLSKMPIKLKECSELNILKRGSQVIIWWIWHTIMRKENNRVLSYGEIAKISGVPRSTVQSAVETMSQKLVSKKDGKILGALMRHARSIGLDLNFVYHKLEDLEMVPKRTRDIDAFDNLDNLI